MPRQSNCLVQRVLAIHGWHPFPFHESYLESELWQLEIADRNTSAKYAYFD